VDHFAFTPHGVCLLWDWRLIGVMVLGNLLVAVAYYLIPFELLRAARRMRAHLPPEVVKVVLMFGVFIVSCGTGHLILIWLLWHPSYWFEACWTLFCTAASSWYCALYIFRRMHGILAILSNPMSFSNLKHTVSFQELKERIDLLEARFGGPLNG